METCSSAISRLRDPLNKAVKPHPIGYPFDVRKYVLAQGMVNMILPQKDRFGGFYLSSQPISIRQYWLINRIPHCLNLGQIIYEKRSKMHGVSDNNP